LLRLTWLLAAGLTGFMPGFIVYFLAIFIVPVKPAV
jgi:phage shock protein PspC (stress-responsive transcriptional regulator)